MAEVRLEQPIDPVTRVPVVQLLSPEFMAKLGALGVVSRKILAGKLRGERRSKKRGESLEFADHRQYSQGDDLRAHRLESVRPPRKTVSQTVPR